MDGRHWFEAEALMADSRSHHHTMRGSSEGEIERRMEKHYPAAVVILARKAENEGSARIHVSA
jgi:hypothetical protein